MASTNESTQEVCCSGRRRRHEPPTEEERRQREGEFKQEFLDEYRKQHGDELISAEQIWKLYQEIDERWHAKMKERRQQRSHGCRSSSKSSSRSPQKHDSRSSSGSSSSSSHSPQKHGNRRHHFEKMRQLILTGLEQDFRKDFEATHTANKINAEQAWLLIQKVKQNKYEKWQAEWQTHRHHHGAKEHKHHHGSKDHKHRHGSKDRKHHHGSKDRKHRHGSKDHKHRHEGGDHGHQSPSTNE